MTSHARTSYVKSVVRMFGYAFLMRAGLWIPGGLLFYAEILGIIEEIGL